MEIRSSHGFTLIEVLTVLVILGILSALAIPHLRGHRATAYDAVARSDYVNLQRELYRINADPEETINFMFSSLEGPLRMPSPFDNVELSNGVHLDFAMQVTSEDGSQVTQLIQAYHSLGKKVFRFVSVNGISSEQIFAIGEQPEN